MITHVFDNSNLSQEIFAIGTWGAVICFWDMVASTCLRSFRPGLSLGSYFWQSNYNWVVDRRNIPVEDLSRSQLQSEEEFTDQRSSHFKLCTAVNFKLLWKKSASSFDLPFGTVTTKLKLFQVVERKMYHARQTFEINCHLRIRRKV